VSVLRLTDVVAGYGPYRALNHVDLVVDAGEAVAIVGRNGVGKSSLARVSSGLVEITSGEIEVVGQRGPRLRAHDLARHGVVHLPEGVGLFTGLTIEENLWLRLRTVDATQRRERLDRALELIGKLADRRRSKAGQLSGGQQRLVAVAGALAASPTLLLADEPALGLSPAATDDVYDALTAARSPETTLVVIETRLGPIERLCSRAVVMERGRVTYDGQLAGAAAALELQMGIASPAPEDDETPEA
jgi:branched-chain amino acid transport system ATP-binding protein